MQFQLQVHAAFLSLLVSSYTQYINSIPGTVSFLVQFKILHSASTKQWLLSISLILPHQPSHVPGGFSFSEYFIPSFCIPNVFCFFAACVCLFSINSCILNSEPNLDFSFKVYFFSLWGTLLHLQLFDPSPETFLHIRCFFDPQFDSRSLFLC